MSQNYLIHHGILGQRWGKMQGPPYPLDASDHSSKEKSAAKSAGIKVGKDSGKGSIYSINAKHYNKKADKLKKKSDVNRTMASMNEAAAKNGKGVIAKINKINADYYNKKADKLKKKSDVNRTMASMNEAEHEKRQNYKVNKKDEKRYNATENGSVKTNAKAEKIGEIDKKYANSSDRKWKKEVDKAFKDYEKSANKDEKTALKNGDVDAARSINAGRTYMRTIIDGNYRLAAIALANNVAAGKTYVTDITRDNKLGGVDMVYADGTIFNITDSKH